MTYRAIYTCDLCSDETPKDKIYGLCFSNLTRFTVGRPEATRGKHVCMRCLDQIHAQTGPRACQCVGRGTWVDSSACLMHGDAPQHSDER